MQYIYSETIVRKPKTVSYDNNFIILSILLAMLFIMNNLAQYDIIIQKPLQIENSSIEITDTVETNETTEDNVTNNEEQTKTEDVSKPESIYAHTVVLTSKIQIKSPSKPSNCLDSNFTLSSNINTYSGLTTKDIQAISQDYPAIYNLAEDIYEMEKYNKINIFYTLGVSSLESGYGESDYAKYKNNLCGLLKKSSSGQYVPIHFNTQRDSIVYFAELMRDYYVPDNLLTPEKIQPVYEPSNNQWDDDVVSIMNKFASRYANLKK